MRIARAAALLLLIATARTPAARAEAWRVIDGNMHHLRRGAAREWDAMGDVPEGDALVINFDARVSSTECTLRLRHRDLKLPWVAQCNGKVVARLPQDENGMLTCWVVPPGTLVDGRNELRIACL